VLLMLWTWGISPLIRFLPQFLQILNRLIDICFDCLKFPDRHWRLSFQRVKVFLISSRIFEFLNFLLSLFDSIMNHFLKHFVLMLLMLQSLYISDLWKKFLGRYYLFYIAFKKFLLSILQAHTSWLLLRGKISSLLLIWS